MLTFSSPVSHQPSRILLGRWQQAGCCGTEHDHCRNAACNICAKIQEGPPLASRSVLWKGKGHFHFRKAAGFGWVFMTTTTITLFSRATTRRKAEQLLAAQKLPTSTQTCSSISFWSPLAPPAFALPLSTANRPAPGICQEPLSLEKLGLPHPQKSRQCSKQATGAMGQRAGSEWQRRGNKQQVVMSHKATAGACPSCHTGDTWQVGARE